MCYILLDGCVCNNLTKYELCKANVIAMRPAVLCNRISESTAYEAVKCLFMTKNTSLQEVILSWQ